MKAIITEPTSYFEYHTANEFGGSVTAINIGLTKANQLLCIQFK